MIEIRAVGGYGEVGKNCTAVKVDDEVVIFDMGLHLPNYIKYTEEERGEVIKLSAEELRKVGAVPDVSLIEDWEGQVKAIIPSHAHLDHIGAIPYLAGRFRAPVICTPFTAAVLKAILKDEKIKIPNKIKPLYPNATMKLSKNLRIEFINMPHSTPQTVSVALHTPYGVVLYATDFKLDGRPVLGKKPNYKALQRINGKVVVAFIDSLYAYDYRKMPCEGVAREMLRDVMLEVGSENKAMIITTFSSHIARLKSIVEFGKELRRKIIFMGRSLAKYSRAAEEVGIISFSKKVDICRFGRQVRERLRQVQKRGVGKYLLVVTGHQGEPKAILPRLVRGELPFKLQAEDHVIFSCQIIPTEINRAHRAVLEQRLREKGIRIFKDIHVSGHGAREDMRDLINLIEPKHLIPVHSEEMMMNEFRKLSEEMGYGEETHLLLNGQSMLVKP